jgi:hypothetical protein
MVEVLSATHLARRVTPCAEKRMVLQASTENLTLGFDDADGNLKLATTLTPLLQSSPFIPLAVHPALVPFQLTLRCPPGEHTLVPTIGYTGETRGYPPRSEELHERPTTPSPARAAPSWILAQLNCRSNLEQIICSVEQMICSVEQMNLLS